MQIRGLIKLARPGHWIKNVVVLMPVVFGQQMREPGAWGAAFAAAAVFCLAASFSYIINDIKDRDTDRSHPLKRNRPLPSGQVSVRTAFAEAGIFLALSLVLAGVVSTLLGVVTVLYLGLQIAYTLRLKQEELIDVICIALGFVLRAAAGAVAISVYISPWLFICMFTICLFMGFCKRYNEVITIGNSQDAQNHRSTLTDYTPELLTHLIDVSAGIAIVAFLFYGLSESTVTRFGTHYIVYTLPITVYAVFRFAMLSMKGKYQDPTDLILHDRPFQAAIAVWALAIMLIIVYGRSVSAWLGNLY